MVLTVGDERCWFPWQIPVYIHDSVHVKYTGYTHSTVGAVDFHDSIHAKYTGYTHSTVGAVDFHDSIHAKCRGI